MFLNWVGPLSGNLFHMTMTLSVINWSTDVQFWREKRPQWMIFWQYAIQPKAPNIWIVFWQRSTPFPETDTFFFPSICHFDSVFLSFCILGVSTEHEGCLHTPQTDISPIHLAVIIQTQRHSKIKWSSFTGTKEKRSVHILIQVPAGKAGMNNFSGNTCHVPLHQSYLWEHVKTAASCSCADLQTDRLHPPHSKPAPSIFHSLQNRTPVSIKLKIKENENMCTI